MNDRTGYKLTFSTPNSECRIEADSIDELVRIVPNYVGEILSKCLIPRVNIYEKATKIHQDYNRRFPLSGRHYARSAAARGGHELDVIVCYLLGWTAHETVQWLKKHRSFVVSKSSISRYFTNLRKMKVVPVSDLQDSKIQIKRWLRPRKKGNKKRQKGHN